MLTKNFYVVLANSFFAPKVSTVFKDINGSTTTSTPAAHSSKLPFSYMHKWKATTNSDYGVVFSTDTTPPSVDDYKIVSTLGTNSLSVNTPSEITIVNTDTNIRYSATFTVHNITAESLTITKLGYIGYSYGTTWIPFLADVCLLNTPVTIAPDGVANITYEICINYPTATT